jgi:hypothetical protein
MEKHILHKEIKFLKVLLFLFLFFILSLPALLSFGLNFVPYSFQPPFLGSERLFDDAPLTQEFISPQDNLAAIGVSIRNFNLQSKGDVTLEVILDKNVIRRSVVNRERIKDGDMVIFKFDKIEDSSGKNFVFRLSTLGVDKQKAFEVYTTADKQDFAGDLKVGEYVVEKPISFLLYFAPESRLSLIRDIYTSWILRFSQDPSFFYSFAAFISIFFLGILILR